MTAPSRHGPARALGRRAVVLGLALCLLGKSPPARAGSYLDRAWFLINEATRAHEFLARRLYDRELARLVSQSAEGRLQAAKDTLVPKEVVLAHPHLLLMLEHYERAAAAAADGDPTRFYELARSAQDEEQLFRGVLKQLGWSLPPSKP